jgi:hypothetical protein
MLASIDLYYSYELPLFEDSSFGVRGPVQITLGCQNSNDSYS